MPRSAIPLWPLPLAVAVVLVVATHLAWLLSVQAGHIPFCVPYIEGCTSISRAARHGLGNHLFRLMVLPCALLVFLHWWLAGRWLPSLDHANAAYDMARHSHDPHVLPNAGRIKALVELDLP